MRHTHTQRENDCCLPVGAFQLEKIQWEETSNQNHKNCQTSNKGIQSSVTREESKKNHHHHHSVAGTPQSHPPDSIPKGERLNLASNQSAGLLPIAQLLLSSLVRCESFHERGEKERHMWLAGSTVCSKCQDCDQLSTNHHCSR